MPLLISLSFVLFILDIFSSLKTVKQWLLFENTCSLLTGLMQFFHDGQYILLIIVALFSLIVPLIKLFLVTFAINTSSWAASERHSIIHWLSLVGKCSMIDVFIVAILVVVGKSRGMAEVEINDGRYTFAASVILIHIATYGMETDAKRAGIDVTT